MNNSNDNKKGISLAVFSYLLWGFFPLFWHFLDKSTPLQTLAHRISWSFLTILIILLLQKKLKIYLSYIIQPKIIGFYTITGGLLAINWLVFIWAVGQGRVLESSLGYFILPLIGVLLGVVFLKERLRASQWAIIGLTTIGIIFLSIQVGRFPWVALTLALSFAVYGLLKKNAPTQADISVALEMTPLVIPAIIYIIYSHAKGIGVYGNIDIQTTFLLSLTGLVTVIPTITYSTAVPLIPLSLAGILFYINPTLQFVSGAVILNEPFNSDQLIGYIIIWIALILYFIEGWREKNKSKTSS